MATLATLTDLALREQHTDIEDTVTITRENGETACFAVQHFDRVKQLHLGSPY